MKARVALIVTTLTAALPVTAVAQVASIEVHETSIAELQAALANRRTTSVALVDAYMARMAAYDQAGPRLNTIIRLNPLAREDAAELDAERAAGNVRGPLHGIPILLKDNFDYAGMPTTGSSIALAGLMPPDDAFQVKRLRAAGAIVLGKTNLHELASGILTISSLGGQTRNPYDPSRNPGGSSGGSAAAVAASFAAIAWGTDTCGSIRIPAAHNALFGLRPTKGLSSVDGVLPLSHSQDVAGPLARTVADLAVGLDATIGMDAADSATRALQGLVPPRFSDALQVDALRGARIGVLTSYFGTAADDREVADVVRRALEQLKAQGATVIDVVMPNLDSLIANTSTITHEFKYDLQDYLAATPGAPVTGLGDILERGLFHAALESSFRTRNAAVARETDALRRVHARRDTLHRAVLQFLDAQQLDALVYPTIRRQATRVGEPQPGANCQLSASTGMPAMTAVAGFTNDGLPVGFELLGRRFDDARLVAFAYAHEQAARTRRPPHTTPPLTSGAAPPPPAFNLTASAPQHAFTVHAHFALDRYRDELSYRLEVTGTDARRIHAVVLQRFDADRAGPVEHRLSGVGATRADGVITLSAAQRAEFLEGRWSLVAYIDGVAAARTVAQTPR